MHPKHDNQIRFGCVLMSSFGGNSSDSEGYASFRMRFQVNSGEKVIRIGWIGSLRMIFLRANQKKAIRKPQSCGESDDCQKFIACKIEGWSSNLPSFPKPVVKDNAKHCREQGTGGCRKSHGVECRWKHHRRKIRTRDADQQHRTYIMDKGQD